LFEPTSHCPTEFIRVHSRSKHQFFGAHFISRRTRFDREARAIARLHHTNIVDVFGNGEHQGMPFFAMRLIDGAGLDSLIRQARSGDSSSQSGSPACRAPTTDSASLDANSSRGEPRITATTGHQQSRPEIPDDIDQRCEFAAKIGSQIGLALNYADERGVVHRDLKPSRAHSRPANFGVGTTEPMEPSEPRTRFVSRSRRFAAACGGCRLHDDCRVFAAAEYNSANDCL